MRWDSETPEENGGSALSGFGSGLANFLSKAGGVAGGQATAPGPSSATGRRRGPIVPPYFWAMKDVYEASIEATLRSSDVADATNPGEGERWRGTLHVKSLSDLKDADRYSAVVVWHDTDFTLPPMQNPPFKPIADYFNIWHEWYRTAHGGCLHQLRWQGTETLVYLVNVRDDSGNPSRYRRFRPGAAHVFTRDAFNHAVPPVPRAVAESISLVAAPERGVSCDDVCAARGGGVVARRATAGSRATSAGYLSPTPATPSSAPSHARAAGSHSARNSPRTSFPGRQMAARASSRRFPLSRLAVRPTPILAAFVRAPCR